jgi:hypothetical protein
VRRAHAVLREIAREQLEQPRIVIDDQHVDVHGPSLADRAAPALEITASHRQGTKIRQGRQALFFWGVALCCVKRAFAMAADDAVSPVGREMSTRDLKRCDMTC